MTQCSAKLSLWKEFWVIPPLYGIIDWTDVVQTNNEFCKQTNDYSNHRKNETKTQKKQTTEGKENERNETTRRELITTTPEDPCIVFYLPHLP